MFSVSNTLRGRVRELEQRGDVRGLHALLSGWPWPIGQRPDAEVAFAEVQRRIATHEFKQLLTSPTESHS
jgi:hypothetical protein